MRMTPEVGSISRATQRATVVLPEPDSPTMPTVSPRRTVMSTLSAARTTRPVRKNRLLPP